MFALGAFALHAARFASTRFVETELTWAGPDFYWMSPISYIGAFLLLGVPLGIASLIVPPLRNRRVPVFIFSTLMLFGALSLIQSLHPLASLALALGVSVRLLPSDNRATLWPPRWARVLAGVGVMIGVMAVAESVSRPMREAQALDSVILSPAPTSPNVLLLILDTVRSANLSAYGYRHPTTPNLSRLASEGALFERAYATAPWTLPSHGSFFTGRFPGELTGEWSVPIDGQHPMLAEHLRSRGFVTAGFVANSFYTQRESGLARGFIHYAEARRSWQQIMYSNVYVQLGLMRRVLITRDPLEFFRSFELKQLRLEPMYASHRRTSAPVIDEFLTWQRELPARRPFFAFLNLYDAHVPYYAPDSIQSRFAGLTTGKMGRYDAAIAWQDLQIGRLVDSLKSRGVLDNTIVIVSSDHGEQFGEHGLHDHSNSLYLPVLQVPLILRYPARIPGGVRSGRVASTRDVPATILDLTGSEGANFPGASLADHWTSTDTSRADHALAEVSRLPDSEPGELAPNAAGPLRAVIERDWHFIAGPNGAEALFAYRSDTAELHNRAGDTALSAEVRRLRSVLEATPSRLNPSDGTARRRP